MNLDPHTHYEVIDDDKLDKGANRWTCPPPELPKSQRPVRYTVMSDTYTYHRKKTEPLRMVDATNPDRNLSYRTSEANRQILLSGVPENASIKDISTTFKTEILTRSDDLEEIKVDRVHKEAIVTLRTSRGRLTFTARRHFFII